MRTQTPLRTVALVGCCKKKLDRAAPARDLYRSPLFQLSLQYAEQTATPGHVWILSARHGLVEPGQVVEPYDLSLEHFDGEELADWAHVVGIQLADALGFKFDERIFHGVRFVLLAASRYAPDLILPPEQPLAGMQIGQRLQWLQGQLWSPAVAA